MPDRKSVSQLTDTELAELYDHADEMASHARELAETVQEMTTELARSREWAKALKMAAAKEADHGQK